jgi:hypothetical protein
MVATPDGTGVIHIGGHYTSTDLYLMSCSVTSCNWKLMDKKLEVSRAQCVAMYVPDSMVECTIN